MEIRNFFSEKYRVKVQKDFDVKIIENNDELTSKIEIAELRKEIADMKIIEIHFNTPNHFIFPFSRPYIALIPEFFLIDILKFMSKQVEFKNYINTKNIKELKKIKPSNNQNLEAFYFIKILLNQKLDSILQIEKELKKDHPIMWGTVK